MNQINRESEKKELQKIDKTQAEVEVRATWQRMHTMGANDYEPGAIGEILEGLEKGTIEPEEAVRQALEIEAAKQDYH